MISIKEFVKIIENSKTVEHYGDEVKEVYNNEVTGVKLLLEVFDNSSSELEKRIPVVNIYTNDNRNGRDILIEDELEKSFIKWALENDYFDDWDDKHEYYANEHDFYDVDYINMDFKDELVQKFYEEKKDEYLFFHPLLPLDVHKDVMSCNQGEGWFYEKHLETELVLKIYEHLVNNKL